ncbi:hypothetical protein [Acidithiobacillus ferrivorans]|nr:hypothetical protein [Acidithiobacillus ferrivorans]
MALFCKSGAARVWHPDLNWTEASSAQSIAALLDALIHVGGHHEILS